MFNSLEETKQIIEFIRDYNNPTATYGIDHYKLLSICEDYIIAQQCCDDYSKEIESLRNYIRLLEKENKALTHQEDKGE